MAMSPSHQSASLSASSISLPASSASSIPNTDRVHLLPAHYGPNVFPNTPLFSKLLRHAHRGRLAIRDLRTGVNKTYAELLSDVLGLRGILEVSLDKDTLRQIEREQEVFLGVLAAGGYEYTVAILAVLALGAAAVPMTVGLPVEEAAYFVTKSRQVALLTATGSETLGDTISKHVLTTHAQTLINIPIGPALLNLPSINHTDMHIASSTYLSDNAASIVIFTSGTTGPPKGAVMRRAYVHDGAIGVIDHYDITSSDVILHVLPVHHATGIGITFTPFLFSGATIEFRSGSFDPAWMWERWRQGGLTFFSGVPTIYMRMMRFYEHHIAKLPVEERQGYVDGANQFRAMLCGSSALPTPIQEFWSNLRRGQKILTRYGATEFGAVFKVGLNDPDVPHGSVGKVAPGVDIKLSNGDEGEVLVRGPHMFSKYLFDPTATAAAHDSQGYFRTGDIARRIGPYYFIVGRASLDIIKSGGFKISALDIEREILGLPYVSEVMVVGVSDEEFGQRVAAVVTLRDDQDVYSVTPGGKKLLLDDLRADLRGKLTGYKLPTLLRVMEGELPKGQSGKVLKKILGPKLFPVPGWEKDPETQVWANKKAQVLAKL